MSGIIAKRWVLSGDVVQPGQSMLAMYNISHVWVTANYEETKLREIKSNDRVSITLDAYPGIAWNGHV
ncbi:efflux RND transporter periplasmic adaptor subunit, partial [Olsenella uli]|uniref:efflux RND transporter periplasmic adaptor subunit n=1 Tax=Olsenella uli TaxID=133926 RepID=UPI001EF53CCD